MLRIELLSPKYYYLRNLVILLESLVVKLWQITRAGTLIKTIKIYGINLVRSFDQADGESINIIKVIINHNDIH